MRILIYHERRTLLGLLTPGGFFHHSSIIEANVGVSPIDLTLTETENNTNSNIFSLNVYSGILKENYSYMSK